MKNQVNAFRCIGPECKQFDPQIYTTKDHKSFLNPLTFKKSNRNRNNNNSNNSNNNNYANQQNRQLPQMPFFYPMQPWQAAIPQF